MSIYRPCFTDRRLDACRRDYLLPGDDGEQAHHVKPTACLHTGVPHHLFTTLVAEHGGVIGGTMPNMNHRQNDHRVAS